ncbi:hypothetical protein [Actinobaculum suis]|uniref:hypothetical protein n=1 Tax=Actinobaculum suis TaxID=1657 RepID=UPI0008086CCA|nr:hypothetical protein [Actinobaculum suis]OCA93483.1 hypothetical protein ACU20_01375 [Actinobaculum suis]OCA95233.1 hypothetical protein ACU21_04540 [Actinobaculum suis]
MSTASPSRPPATPHASAAANTSNVVAVAASAIVSGLAGFFLTVVSARVLSLQDNASFLVFWSAFSAITAVLSGIQNETTRAVRAARHTGNDSVPAGTDHIAPHSKPATPNRRTTRVFAAIGLIAVLAALVVAALWPAWRAIFGAQAPLELMVPTLMLVAFAYPGQLGTVGALAGQNNWNLFAVLSAAEPTGRLVLAGVAGLAGTGLAGLYVGVTLATLTWAGFGCLQPVRRAWRAEASLDFRQLLSRMAQAMAATAFSAVLINGFPMLMSLTSDAAVYSAAAPLVTAVSVTRAPLLMPLVAFQSMVIAAFVDRPEKAGSALVKLLAGIAGVAAMGGVAAYFLGPWLMRFIYGPDYVVPGLVLGLLVAAAACLALLMLGGAIALALDLHRWNMAGWALAVVISVTLMFMPAALEIRTISALMIGPLCGSAVHLSAIYRALQARARVR